MPVVICIQYIIARRQFKIPFDLFQCAHHSSKDVRPNRNTEEMYDDALPISHRLYLVHQNAIDWGKCLSWAKIKFGVEKAYIWITVTINNAHTRQQLLFSVEEHSIWIWTSCVTDFSLVITSPEESQIYQTHCTWAAKVCFQVKYKAAPLKWSTSMQRFHLVLWILDHNDFFICAEFCLQLATLKHLLP